MGRGREGSFKRRNLTETTQGERRRPTRDPPTSAGFFKRFNGVDPRLASYYCIRLLQSSIVETERVSDWQEFPVLGEHAPATGIIASAVTAVGMNLPRLEYHLEIGAHVLRLVLAAIRISHAEGIGGRQQLLVHLTAGSGPEITPSTCIVLNTAGIHQGVGTVSKVHQYPGDLKDNRRVTAHVLRLVLAAIRISHTEGIGGRQPLLAHLATGSRPKITPGTCIV
jgi:hypothetical protein